MCRWFWLLVLFHLGSKREWITPGFKERGTLTFFFYTGFLILSEGTAKFILGLFNWGLKYFLLSLSSKTMPLNFSSLQNLIHFPWKYKSPNIQNNIVFFRYRSPLAFSVANKLTVSRKSRKYILYNGKISWETSSRNLHILCKTPDFFKLGMALQTSSWLSDVLQLNMPGLDH